MTILAAYLSVKVLNTRFTLHKPELCFAMWLLLFVHICLNYLGHKYAHCLSLKSNLLIFDKYKRVNW